MSPKAWMINLILAVAVVFLGIKTYDAWSRTENPLPEAGDGKPSAPVPHKTVVKADIPAETEYDSVVRHNLFSVSRSPQGKEREEPEQKSKGAEQPDPRLLKTLQQTVKQISVYGVMMVDGEKKALLRSPPVPVLKRNRTREPSPPPGQEITWVKVGDPVNRFTVKEINTRGVVLGAEGLAFDVVLYDERKPKKRTFQEKVTGPVVIRMEEGTQADAPSEKEKAQAPEEKSPEKKLPIEAEEPEEKRPVKKLPVEAEGPEKKQPEKKLPVEARSWGKRPGSASE